jgi:hypothetical protein
LVIPASVTDIGYAGINIGPYNEVPKLYFLGNPPTGDPIGGYQDRTPACNVYYIEGTPGWGEELGWAKVEEYIPFTPWGPFVTVDTELGTYADTGDFMGWLYVSEDPWVWCVDMNHWLYCPKEIVTESGAWVYMPR